MQIHYGQDTDGDGIANRYVIADVINRSCLTLGNDDCWNHISGVRIALLLQSDMDSIVTQPQTYSFDGLRFTAPDKRLRREYVTLISLKNRRSLRKSRSKATRGLISGDSREVGEAHDTVFAKEMGRPVVFPCRGGSVPSWTEGNSVRVPCRLAII